MNYKTLFFLTFLLFCDSIYAQDPQVNVFQRNLAIDYRIRDLVVNVKLSKNEDGEKVLGSYFLFDDWKNNSTIQIQGKKFAFNNVNFNVQNNEFMSEVSKDSVFTLLPKYIEAITINNKVYKYRMFKGEHKFFEVLFESKKKLSVYKGYHIRIIPKSEMGVLNRPYDEIKKDEKFYVYNGSELETLKFKKKDVLKFIDAKDQSTILNYVKSQNLSFKKVKDVVRVFKYYDTI